MKKYLYIFEDGEVRLSDREPNEFELQFVDEGVLRIFNLEVQKEVLWDGSLKVMEEEL